MSAITHNSGRFRRVTQDGESELPTGASLRNPDQRMESSRRNIVPLSLLALAVNCCGVTLGDMLTFKLVLGGKLRIRKSQLQTQLGFAEYW